MNRHVLLLVLLAAMLCPAVEQGSVAGDDRDVGVAFEKKYLEWKRKRLAVPVWASDYGPEVAQVLESMTQLGPAVVPHVVKKMREDQACDLCVVVTDITGVKLPNVRGAPSKAKAVITWWDDRRQQLPRLFCKRYDAWTQAKQKTHYLSVSRVRFDDKTKTINYECQHTDLGHAYYDLRDMGIDILPLLVQEFRRGEYDLLMLFWEIVMERSARMSTHSEQPDWPSMTLDESVEYTLDWWEKNKEYWLLPPPEGMGKGWYLQKPGEETKGNAPHVKKGENKGAGAMEDEKAEPKPGAQDTKKQPAPQPEKPKE